MDTNGLYTNNSNNRRDFVTNAITELTTGQPNVYIAVAFFTEADVIKRIVAEGCYVRLVVRLGFPTHPRALAEVMGIKGVDIRYFTDNSFHPKLYLFGTKAALVGSANLTKSAIERNQEIVAVIDSEDERLNELAQLFENYWKQAHVLTATVLSDYKAIFTRFEIAQHELAMMEGAIDNKLVKVVFKNVQVTTAKQSKDAIFLEEYRKTYQECVAAFGFIREIYEQSGFRKVSPERIPLRLEIDSFISFVRDIHATKETWRTQPTRSGAELQTFVSGLIQEWKLRDWPHFEDTIVNYNYPLITNVLGSPESIAAATATDIVDALTVLHSFYERMRFYRHGLITWQKYFLASNDIGRIKAALTYLLYGDGLVEERMANYLYGADYHLIEFHQSSVQELIGWCGTNDLPVVNGRTTKVLRYFGFNVIQLSD